MTLSPAERTLRYLLLVALALVGAWCSATNARAQMGFDRPGGDYAHTSVLTRDPSDCAMLCERDKRCRAWSFNFPRDAQSSATCWLKNTLPPRANDKCCVSGVRGAGVIEPHGGPFEMFVDRFGGDYRNFEIKNGDGDHACQEACTGDTKCRAWTYARAGYAGRDARCFLKGEIKPPRRAPGLVSGVVR
jgi:hypothetical protein